MSRILIVGGHGKVALLLADILTGRGDAVTSVFRNPAHRDDVTGTGATPVVADIESLDVAGLADLVAGHDAVVFAAGAGGGDPQRTNAVDRDAAIRVIDAAAAAGVDRFVMVSYFGAGRDDVPADSSFFAYAQAKAAADEHLRSTSLAWTVLGPSGLTTEPGTGTIRVSTDLADKSEVARADVAQVVATALAEDATVGRTIDFTGGDTPIATALAG